jgi:hypothetical protein
MSPAIGGQSIEVAVQFTPMRPEEVTITAMRPQRNRFGELEVYRVSPYNEVNADDLFAGAYSPWPGAKSRTV